MLKLLNTSSVYEVILFPFCVKSFYFPSVWGHSISLLYEIILFPLCMKSLFPFCIKSLISLLYEVILISLLYGVTLIPFSMKSFLFPFCINSLYFPVIQSILLKDCSGLMTGGEGTLCVVDFWFWVGQINILSLIFTK